jgi:HlyD family secretion protein
VASLKDDLAALRIDHSARAGTSRRGTWVVLLVLLVAAAAGGWLLSQRLQAAPVRTAAVVSRSGTSSAGSVLNASGYVTARRRATVSSKVTGKVVDIFVEEGKAVRKGQVLARLDDSQIRAALNVARAELEAARRGAAEDDTDLADMVVRAPFDGVAISKDAQPGEMISPVSAGGGFTRTGICTIVDMSSLEIEVDVSESYINRVRPGQPVEAVLDAYPDWRIPAHVITMVPSADRQKATVRVRIGFEKLDPKILPDMGVKVAFFETPDTPEAASRPTLLVPKTALRTADGQSIVFVVREDRVERRAVKVGTSEGDQIEIVSGLNAGERVVVEGPDTLVDGTRVKEQ